MAILIKAEYKKMWGWPLFKHPLLWMLLFYKKDSTSKYYLLLFMEL